MEKEILNPEGLVPNPAYSHAVKVTGGTTVYVAGQVGMDDDWNIVSDDFEAQAVKAFENLKTALAAAGATPDDIVMTRVYIVDYDEEKLMGLRKARSEVLAIGTAPASTLLGVASLAMPGLLIEVDAVAVIP